MDSALPFVDRLTRAFWRGLGRSVDLDGAEWWLRAPTHHRARIADEWLRSAALSFGGRVRDDVADAGLLADLAELDGPLFSAAAVHPEIRDFYEHTSAWRMELSARWNPAFRPAGELISLMFGRRVQQLALPIRRSDVARGMDSRVALIVGSDGRQRAAGWFRTLRSTGDYVYSGCYSSALLPDDPQPVVHVAFPLQSGNVQVFLRPRVLPGGALELASSAGVFGSPGSYVLVTDRGTHAARVPINEIFRVYVDTDGAVRTDHHLALGSASVLNVHYKLVRCA